MFDELAAATSVDWLSRFVHLVDAAILTRVAAIAGIPPTSASWCFGGSSGRAESLTSLAPMVLAVFEDGIPDAVAQEQHQQVLAALTRVRIPAAPRPAVRRELLRGERP